MNEPLAFIIVAFIIGVFALYCLKPDKPDRYTYRQLREKYSGRIYKVFNNLINEIDACTEYRQLRAIERQFERECDFYAKHKDYSSFYKVISNLIQEKSIKLQCGMLAV